MTMNFRHYIDKSERRSGGAQVIMHAIHNVANNSKIYGFDYIISECENLKTRKLYSLFSFWYCFWFTNDCIYIHHRVYLLLTFFSRRRNVFFVCHNIFPDKNYIWNLIRIDIIAVSHEVEHYLINRNPNLSVKVIENGVSFDEKCIKNKTTKRSSFKITYIGRLARSKGIDLLIKSYIELRAKYPFLMLDIIGIEGDYSIKNIEGIENIKFYGYRSSPFYHARDANLIVIPSRHEGFGLVYYEALQYGHRVLSSDIKPFKVVSQDNNIVKYKNEDLIDLISKLESEIINKDNIILCSPKKRHLYSTLEEMSFKYLQLVIAYE